MPLGWAATASSTLSTTRRRSISVSCPPRSAGCLRAVSFAWRKLQRLACAGVRHRVLPQVLQERPDHSGLDHPFQVPASASDIGETIQFEVAQERLAKFKASFGDYLNALHTCAISRPQFEPLLFAVLALPQPEAIEPDSRDARDWGALNKHVSSLCDRYVGELGENAYAAFNAVTNFASHPLANGLSTASGTVCNAGLVSG